MDGKWARFKAAWSHDWQATLNAPRPFLVCSAAAVAILYAIFQFLYSARIANLEAAITGKDSTIEGLNASLAASGKEIERLKIVAGIKPGDARTALSVLTNSELASTTINIVEILRKEYARSQRNLSKFETENPEPRDSASKEASARFERLIALRSEQAERISQSVGSSALNLLNELHRRIPEERREHIIRAGISLRSADPAGDESDVRILFLPSAGMFLSAIPVFADELEALAKLLPPD